MCAILANIRTNGSVNVLQHRKTLSIKLIHATLHNHQHANQIGQNILEIIINSITDKNKKLKLLALTTNIYWYTVCELKQF